MSLITCVQWLEAKAVRRFFQAFVVMLLAILSSQTFAGTLTRPELEAMLPAPMVIGEKSTKLPVWPIFQKTAAALTLVGWVFESIDLEPIRGYSGKPINLLVFMDQKGNFLDVRLREHKEPLFLSEAGNDLLVKFAQQYKGLSLQHSITMVRPKQPTNVADGIATVNGVAAGTVSAIAMERSIMESALKVAQAGLGDAGSAAVRRSTRERFESMSAQELVKAGFVPSVKFTHAQAEAGFVKTLAEGLDDRPGQKPDEAVIDFSISLISLELIGKNILNEKTWGTIEASKASGELSFLISENGRLRIAGNEKKPQGNALRLRIKHSSREGEWIELREVPIELAGQATLDLPQAMRGKQPPRMFRTIGAGSLDLTKPLNLVVQSTREVGFDPVRRFQTNLDFPYQPKELSYWLTPPKESRWWGVWKGRWLDLSILIAGLVVLSVALWKQSWLTAKAARLRNFRLVYLIFTLGFIGWYAQGQLTIVNITALIESLRAGEGGEFLLSDPMSLVLWAFVIVSLFIWGRGTFCGWLCPFGALQDLISQLGDLLRIKKVSLRIRTDGYLKWIKYAVLAAVLLSAFFSSDWTEKAIEVEPFKTAISLYFVRSWPYLLWAVICLALSVLVFRGYCRYICPLGAALAVLGKVRIFNWIPRKAECGTPCQTCRHGCGYQAIAPQGKVDYAECFQCLDCVSIEQDVKRCLPLIRKDKPSKVIPLHAVELVRAHEA
jgi:NosR/NirI family transcriptional regulator, nitrous oxide reductase regulator